MALIKWYDDEEQKKKDEQLASSSAQSVTSVQDGSWQPAPSGADAPANGDGQDNTEADVQGNYLMSDEKAQFDEQKRQRDAQIEAARQQAAAQAAAEAYNAQVDSQQVEQAVSQQKGQPKYMPVKKGEGGIKGFLKGVGAGLQQGLGGVADTAIKGGGIVSYAGKRLAGIDDLAAASQANASAEKVRNWLASKKDIQGNNYTGTRHVEEAANRAINGEANLRDYASLAGGSLQIGLDSTMFLNPARLGLSASKTAAKTAASQGANFVARAASSPVVKYAARDAAFFGTLQGTATFQRVYGETGSIEDAINAAAKDAAIGAVMQGTLDIAGRGVGVAANRTMNSLRRGEKGMPTVDVNGLENIAEEGAQAGGAQKLDTLTPENQTPKVADGVVTPVQDGNIAFEPNTPQPIVEGAPNQPNSLTPVVENTPQAVDPALQTPIENVTPVSNNPQMPENTVQPVADGIVRPTQVVPETNPNMPVVKSEQVKQLQDARAGKSQADEAVINQELQQLKQETPSVEQPTPQALMNTEEPRFKNLDEAVQEMERPKAGKQGVMLSKPEIEQLNTMFKDVQDPINQQFRGKVYGRFNNSRDVVLGHANGRTVVAELDKNAIPTGRVRTHQTPLNPNDIVGDYGKVNMYSPTVEQSKYLLPTKPSAKKEPTPQAPQLPEGQVQAPEVSSQSPVDSSSQYTPVDPKTSGKNRLGLTKLNEAGAVPIRKGGDASVTPVKSDKTPKVDNLPEGMGGDAPKGEPTPVMGKDGKPLISKNDISDRLITNVNHVEDAKTQLATGLGIPLDSKLSVSEMLSATGVEGKSAKIIEDSFNSLKKNDAIYNKVQEANRKDYVGDKPASPEIDRKRNASLRDSLESLSAVMKEIKYIKKQGDISERAVQALEGIVKYRAVNTLTSLGLFERNAAQEVVATAFRTAQNPIKSLTGMVGYGNPVTSAIKSTIRDTANVPHGITSKARHASSSVYKVGMTPTDALQATRTGMYRDEIARQALKMGGNKNPSIAEVRQLSKRMGAVGEAVAKMYTGVDSQVITRKSALKAGDALMQFVRTGSDADLKAVNKAIEGTSTVSDGIIKQLEASGKMNGKVGRSLMAVINGTFMFTRTAVNATRNSAEIFNPFTPSLVDSIGRTNRSKAGNIAMGLKGSPVKLAVLGAVPVMYAAENIGYNDGDDPSKPRGVWIKTPDGKYINSRSTGLFELPIGMMVLGSEIYKDAQEGNLRDAGYYSGIVTQSLPYIDTAEQASGAVTSLVNTFFGSAGESSDNGYKASAYAINTAKSLVPFSNNSIHPYVEGKKGNSVDAKSAYANKEVPDGKGGTKKVPDLEQWFKNSMYNSYPGLFPDQYKGLKDSRDAAGRVRTVDNQGVVINKTINDVDTKEFNSRITDLVKYGEKNGLGKNTQDMFNTYDTGKNNNFKSAMDAITFTDAPTMNGKPKPDNAKKLEKNAKFTDLSSQMREGFYGTTGSDLLTLDGKNLSSDASVPNADGTKNSHLPMSMQSIKNAVAATDLPPEQRDRMYAISQESQALYNEKVATKQITYKQYQAITAEANKEYVDILSGSASYNKMAGLMDNLDSSGFFKPDGLGSTRSGQTYLWNSLNALLGSKGATPAANYPKDAKGFTPWGKRGGGGSGSGSRATNKPGDRGARGIKWTPAGKREMASVASGKYTPVNIKVKLGNAVKKDKSQNYSDRTF